MIAKTPLELKVRSAADQEQLVADLGSAIKLVPQAKNLFTISYRNASPQLAYDVVQAIMNIFIESRSGSNRADMNNAQTFLAAQIANYEQQLRTAEGARAAFLAKYLDLLPADNTGVSHLDAARTNATSLAGQLTDAVAKRAMLDRELAGTSPVIDTGTEAATGGGSTDLAQARQKLGELLLTETDNHPDVQQQRGRVAMLEAHGGGVVHAGRAIAQPNPVFSQLKVEQVETDAQIGSLRRQVAEAVAERDRLEAIARNAPGIQAQYVNLDRDYDTLRKNYTELLARRESMRLSAAADEEADKIKLRIVDPAQVSRNPISPPRVLLMIGVLGAGLAAGVAAMWALGQLDRSFHSTDTLEALGLPVLGGIYLVADAVPGRRRMLTALPVAGAVLLLCGVCSGLILHALSQLANAT